LKTLDKYLIYFLLAAVAGLYFLHFNSTSTSTSSDPVSEIEIDTLKAPSKGEKTGRIYYVNTDSVWGKYDFVVEVTARLERMKAQYEAQMEKQLRDFEREVQEFRQKGPMMSEVEVQIKQQALVRKETELGKLSEQLEMKFMQEEKVWNDKLRSRIIDFINEHTKDMSYDYVLGYSISSNIILANDSLDLTDAVIQGLNEAYEFENTSE